jgi:lysophospholipase L1-like esterase
MSLVLLSVLELAVRTFLPQVLTGHSLRGEPFSRPDDALVRTYVPGTVWRFRHPEYEVTYAINADGFRDANVRPATKPRGQTRILLLGDSFTFGYGSDYEAIWPVLAERELLRLGHQVDLVKAGVEGMNTRSELALLRQLLARYHPDAVVVGFLINDLYDNKPSSTTSSPPAPQAKAFPPPTWRLPKLQLLILARRLVTATDAGYAALYLAAPQRGEYLRVPLSTQAERQRLVTERLLREMDRVADSAGTPLAVLSIPQQFQVLYERLRPSDTTVNVRLYDQLFGRLAEAEDFAWVATLGGFVQAGVDAELFFRLDGHLTPAGNRVLAELFIRDVMPELERRLGRGHQAARRVP